MVICWAIAREPPSVGTDEIATMKRRAMMVQTSAVERRWRWQALPRMWAPKRWCIGDLTRALSAKARPVCCPLFAPRTFSRLHFPPYPCVIDTKLCYNVGMEAQGAHKGGWQSPLHRRISNAQNEISGCSLAGSQGHRRPHGNKKIAKYMRKHAAIMSLASSRGGGQGRQGHLTAKHCRPPKTDHRKLL